MLEIARHALGMLGRLQGDAASSSSLFRYSLSVVPSVCRMVVVLARYDGAADRP